MKQNTKSKIVLLKGLPASGKTTYAKNLVDGSAGKLKRVGKDDLRSMLDDGKWSRSNEKFILKVRDDLIMSVLSAGCNVVVDDTNLHPKHEERMNQIAGGFDGNVTVETKVFDTPVEECIKRDLARANSVGSKVIMKMYNQFLKPKVNDYPVDKKLPWCVICDIDGTLAINKSNRSPYDWGRVGEDTLNQSIENVLDAVYLRNKDEEVAYNNDKNTIILFSGRDAVCMDETKEWLKKHKIPYGVLAMRSQGDKRKDSIVKWELFEKIIKGKYNVRFVMDDRNQVCKMWRSKGLPLFQVNEGDF